MSRMKGPLPAFEWITPCKVCVKGFDEFGDPIYPTINTNKLSSQVCCFLGHFPNLEDQSKLDFALRLMLCAVLSEGRNYTFYFLEGFMWLTLEGRFVLLRISLLFVLLGVRRKLRHNFHFSADNTRFLKVLT